MKRVDEMGIWRGVIKVDGIDSRRYWEEGRIEQRVMIGVRA